MKKALNTLNKSCDTLTAFWENDKNAEKKHLLKLKVFIFGIALKHYFWEFVIFKYVFSRLLQRNHVNKNGKIFE